MENSDDGIASIEAMGLSDWPGLGIVLEAIRDLATIRLLILLFIPMIM